MNKDCQGVLEKKFRVVNYHTQHGWYVAVVKRIKGRKADYFEYVIVDCPITVSKCAATEERFFDYKFNYPLDKACKSMLKSGKRLGITKGAQALLREALAYEKRN